MLSSRSREEVSPLSKILALYTNEMIKLSRKWSVWILVIIMTVVSFCFPFLARTPEESEFNNDACNKTEITKRRDTEKNTLGDTNRYVEHETLRFTVDNTVVELFATRLTLDEELIYSYANLCCYNAILANYDFDAYPISATYLSIEAFSEYLSTYQELCQLNLQPFSRRDSQWYQMYSSASESLDLVKEAFFYHDYAAYAELIAKKDVSANSIAVKTVNRLMELDPEGKMSYSEAEEIIEALNSCDRYEQNLKMGVYEENDAYLPLNAERKEQLEGSIAILNYQISHGCLSSDRISRAANARLIGLAAAKFVLVIMLIVIAGSSISQEMATGSIKSLIIAPVKRWKIFTAKLLALFTWSILGSILITAFTTISTGLAFGFSSMPSYFYYSGGAVQSMPSYLFTLLFFLVDNISLFVYVLAAFTISCLTRNTGIAVGVSTGLVLSSSITSTLKSLLGHQRWLDFLPSSNMNLVSKVFPYLRFIGFPESEDGGLLRIGNSSLPLSFSLVYLAVLVFILFLIAYDAFVRKDIQ